MQQYLLITLAATPVARNVTRQSILVWGPPHNPSHQMSKERQWKDFVAAEDNPGVVREEIHKANIWDANGYGNTAEINKGSLPVC